MVKTIAEKETFPQISLILSLLAQRGHRIWRKCPLSRSALLSSSGPKDDFLHARLAPTYGIPGSRHKVYRDKQKEINKWCTQNRNRIDSKLPACQSCQSSVSMLKFHGGFGSCTKKWLLVALCTIDHQERDPLYIECYAIKYLVQMEGRNQFIRQWQDSIIQGSFQVIFQRKVFGTIR